MKAWSWLLIIGAALLIKLASIQPIWVEEYYSNRLYPVISNVLRVLFGWIPFSIGDLFYAFLILVIIFRTIQFFKLLFLKKINRQYLLNGLKQIIFFFLFVYVFFYGLWGLNYSRKGITYQLNLEIKKYDKEDLHNLTALLEHKLNQYASVIDLKERDSFNRKKTLFSTAYEAYGYAENEYPFLKQSGKSLKPSIYSYLGNYIGFQGYYNPFSGEGQVNTTIPTFLEPFVSAHEIAHQFGYAKESEANFVGYLVTKSVPNNTYRYSVYFDMFRYSVSELYRMDSINAEYFLENLHPQVKKDIEELKRFALKYKNPVEPIISWVYDGYLQANDQPEGKRTYNQVVAFLIAYYKKYGEESL